MIIETIQLLHRPADEIIPLIKPMLSSDASITGTGYKLIIKSTPENISQIQSLLEEIDINQNLLRVSVSMGKQSETNKQRGSVSVEVKGNTGSVEIGGDTGLDDTKAGGEVTITNEKAKFDSRIYQTDQSKHKPAVQVMSVAEGYWASISMGQSIPIANRIRNPDGTVTESVTYQQVMTGYQVMPRTHGDKVTIRIRPIRQSTPHEGSVIVETTAMETTVTGKLGEWLFLGGTNQEENLNNSGINYRTRIRSTDIDQVWVKVERP